MFGDEVTQFDMIDDLDTIYPDLMMQGTLIDEGALILEPHLFQVDPNAEGCTFTDGLPGFGNACNGDPQKVEQMEEIAITPAKSQGACNQEAAKDTMDKVEQANKKEEQVESAPKGEKKTAESRRLARAERNRLYARQSRLRLKLLVESLERKVLGKRKKNTELRDKLDSYYAKLQKASRELDAEKSAVELAAVRRALDICQDIREKCAWTYRLAKKEQIEIKETTSAARNGTS